MSSKFDSRSSDLEIMDDLNCSGEVVHQTLRELEFINKTLGGNSITISGVKKLLKDKKVSVPEIVDLGCGGGDMLTILRSKLWKEYPGVSYKGIDANPSIIDYAKSHCHDQINFSVMNILSNEFNAQKFDVAIATLFFHHFSDDELIIILKKLKSQSRIGIVINDLHRHPLAYYSIKILTQLFSKSSMVKFDAPLSVLRGFKKSEWKKILDEAGIKNYSIQWKWAFRWKIIIPIS